MIIEINRSGLRDAARIHSVSWQESHRSFCAPEFIALHTPEHQEEYLRDKMDHGARVFMLTEDKPVGIVSVDGTGIEPASLASPTLAGRLFTTEPPKKAKHP